MREEERRIAGRPQGQCPPRRWPQHNLGAGGGGHIAPLAANSLLEVDVLLLPVPQVGEVPGVRLGLAGEERILGDVDRDVLRRGNDEGRSWRGERKVSPPPVQVSPPRLPRLSSITASLAGSCWRAPEQSWPRYPPDHRVQGLTSKSTVALLLPTLSPNLRSFGEGALHPRRTALLLPGHTSSRLPSSHALLQDHITRGKNPGGKQQSARSRQQASTAEQRTPHTPLSAGSC